MGLTNIDNNLYKKILSIIIIVSIVINVSVILKSNQADFNIYYMAANLIKEGNLNKLYDFQFYLNNFHKYHLDNINEYLNTPFF